MRTRGLSGLFVLYPSLHTPAAWTPAKRSEMTGFNRQISLASGSGPISIGGICVYNQMQNDTLHDGEDNDGGNGKNGYRMCWFRELLQDRQ